MKPSDLVGKFPYDSVRHENESETVALNIAVILARTGNVFRLVGWDEYWHERAVDGALPHQAHSERRYFDKVSMYLVTEETARLFSKQWNLP